MIFGGRQRSSSLTRALFRLKHNKNKELVLDSASPSSRTLLTCCFLVFLFFSFVFVFSPQKISALTVPEDVSLICMLFLAVLEEECPL